MVSTKLSVRLSERVLDLKFRDGIGAPFFGAPLGFSSEMNVFLCRDAKAVMDLTTFEEEFDVIEVVRRMKEDLLVPLHLRRSS